MTEQKFNKICCSSIPRRCTQLERMAFGNWTGSEPQFLEKFVTFINSALSASFSLLSG